MAADELPFDLIEAKLAPPALRADTVVKAELIERLRASPARVLTLVAPAGFGKTTLLAQLAARDERAFATVALDERDDDPVVLLRYVAAALSRVAPVSESVFDALTTPGRSVWATCIPRVCAALSAVPQPIVLVLDDVHFVRDPASHDAIAALVDHVPEGSRIVLATREELELPIARLRVQRRLLEVGPEDLRLDVEEAAALLEHADVDLDTEAVLELTERTEGWPAGLYLAALSLKAGGSAAGGIRGDDRLIADYLRQELLSRLTAEDVRFLTRTSVLEGMSGSLCDALLLREDSADVLEALERSNRFLVPLDRTRTWYRYHHLFRDLLRSELQHREPDMAAELSRRAMAWCQAHALPELALQYAQQAGAADTVAQLLERLALPTYFAGGVATLEAWFDWFDDDELRERYPTISVLGAWVHYLSGRPEQGALWERAARASTATHEPPDDSATIAPWIATLRAHSCPDGIEQMQADARLALEQSGPERLVATGSPARRRRSLRARGRRRPGTGGAHARH